jgi:hypothetical protein
MGWNKERRPTLAPGGRVGRPTIISSTGTVLPRYGTAVTSTANLKGKVFRLPAPKLGDQVEIVNVQPGSSKGAFKIQAGLTTAANFFGSTYGVITFTSGKKTGSVRLIAVSTKGWTIANISTGVTVAG